MEWLFEAIWEAGSLLLEVFGGGSDWVDEEVSAHPRSEVV
jgi:hypothetical protein